MKEILLMILYTIIFVCLFPITISLDIIRFVVILFGATEHICDKETYITSYLMRTTLMKYCD